MKSGGRPRWANAATLFAAALMYASKGLNEVFSPAPRVAPPRSGRTSRTPRFPVARDVRIAAYKRQRAANRLRRRIARGK